MRRVLNFVWASVKNVAVAFLLFSTSYLIGSMALFQTQYTLMYDDSYRAMEREHERQVIVAEFVESQTAWENTAMTVRDAYLDVKGQNCKLERELYILQRDVSTFMYLLQVYHPGVREHVIDMMTGKPTPAEKKEENEETKDD